MASLIAYNTDEGLRLTRPGAGYTTEQAAAAVGVSDYIVVDDADLPDRNKREAWVLQGNIIVIDESLVYVDHIHIMRDMVKDIAPSVLMRYPGHIGLIGQFLDAGSTPEAIGLIQQLDTVIQDAHDTEAKAEIDKVLQLLQQAGLIQ